MFDVGPSEVLLILGLALLVLGPEKLPGLAAKVGRWTGRARSMARQLRMQLEQEVTLDEVAKSRTHTPYEPPPFDPVPGEPGTEPAQSAFVDLDAMNSKDPPMETPPIAESASISEPIEATRQ